MELTVKEAPKTQGNLGIEPEVLKEIYRQMSRIRAVDKAIQAGLSGGQVHVHLLADDRPGGDPGDDRRS